MVSSLKLVPLKRAEGAARVPVGAVAVARGWVVERAGWDEKEMTEDMSGTVEPRQGG